MPIVSSGVWTADDTFTLTLRYYETPFYQTLTCHFAGDQLTMDVVANVGFVVKKYTIPARA